VLTLVVFHGEEAGQRLKLSNMMRGTCHSH